MPSNPLEGVTVVINPGSGITGPTFQALQDHGAKTVMYSPNFSPTGPLTFITSENTSLKVASMFGKEPNCVVWTHTGKDGKKEGRIPSNILQDTIDVSRTTPVDIAKRITALIEPTQFRLPDWLINSGLFAKHDYSLVNVVGVKPHKLYIEHGDIVEIYPQDSVSWSPEGTPIIRESYGRCQRIRLFTKKENKFGRYECILFLTKNGKLLDVDFVGGCVQGISASCNRINVVGDSQIPATITEYGYGTDPICTHKWTLQQMVQ